VKATPGTVRYPSRQSILYRLAEPVPLLPDRATWSVIYYVWAAINSRLGSKKINEGQYGGGTDYTRNPKRE